MIFTLLNLLLSCHNIHFCIYPKCASMWIYKTMSTSLFKTILYLAHFLFLSPLSVSSTPTVIATVMATEGNDNDNNDGRIQKIGDLLSDTSLPLKARFRALFTLKNIGQY